ncbi:MULTISPECIES: phosphate acyltransferase PlsX [Ferrimicrobium]|uniref:Phosphate acyltransferase n=1 Tax=Ferrimicrobium acidiphilum TaxID=121039 RepID=A0ABV3Y731_9ACTN|nr:phosphate acyltransferase PlsX [Ferrimicrobium sp.]
MKPVAVDLMGGDNGPAVIVEGINVALGAGAGEIVVVGSAEACRPLDRDPRVSVVLASEEISMSDDPASAPRRKRDASMVVGATLLKEQKVSAFVTFGNSGAAMATALVKVGRIRGVARPAIAVELPVPGSASTVLLDAGANTEVTPSWLHQFAVMGSVYCAARLGIAHPRVGLLSIGEEPGKGNSLVKETFKLLTDEPSINFIGNVEGRDVMSDRVDVVVTDGFTGNVVLKSLEGAAHVFAHAVLGALSEGDDGVLDLALPKLLPLWNQMTPDDTGAAALLGVNGLFLIGHGASNARAVASAVRNARQLGEADVVETIRKLEGSTGE